jgi:cobalt-zinc-cadmium efflux system outer membrane protein
MIVRRIDPRLAWTAALLAGLGASRAVAQGPTIHGGPSYEPGSMTSTLGPMPGAGVSPFGNVPGASAGAGALGGPPGTTFPRVPGVIMTPGETGPPPSPGVLAPPRLSITNVPLYGPLAVPDAAEEEGPPDGLTLDAAIEHLLRENLNLRVQSWQIPLARADILSASLRANPILYADAQLVPYGKYSKDRSGGPTQYDVNIAHPVDYSFKRQARTAAAVCEVSVVEAQYRDAARTEIDNLYTAFVDVLAARETVRYAQASVVGLGTVVKTSEELFRRADLTRPDVDRMRILKMAAELGVIQSEETLRQTRRTLATLLNLPPDAARTLEVRGMIADLAPPPPPIDQLVKIALESRPDLNALRLAITRAQAQVGLARANRYGDAYVLYQPYTFQDNAQLGLKSATSWALGATIPVPLYNRNQGGVLRTRLNVDQTRTELAALERQVVSEVHNAEREYTVTKGLLHRHEADQLPSARQQRDVTRKLFTEGELTALDAYHAERDYNEVVRRYRDTLIRHRRSMLILNTVLGRRVLP